MKIWIRYLLGLIAAIEIGITFFLIIEGDAFSARIGGGLGIFTLFIALCPKD